MRSMRQVGAGAKNWVGGFCSANRLEDVFFLFSGVFSNSLGFVKNLGNKFEDLLFFGIGRMFP